MGFRRTIQGFRRSVCFPISHLHRSPPSQFVAGVTEQLTESPGPLQAQVAALVASENVRPAGISSIQAELMAALRRTRPVRDYLTEQGWPRPAAGVGLTPARRIRGKSPPSNPPQTQASWWVLMGTQRDSWGLGGLPQHGTGQGKEPFSQGIVRPRVSSAHLTVDPVVAGSSPVALAK